MSGSVSGGGGRESERESGRGMDWSSEEHWPTGRCSLSHPAPLRLNALFGKCYGVSRSRLRAEDRADSGPGQFVVGFLLLRELTSVHCTWP